MDFHYETLNDQRFQQLSQALVAAQFPNTQCFPVGQPDGGRDAISFPAEPVQNGFIVFQVKFSRNPNSKTERNAIEALIKSEHEKVKKLISRGATRYVLVTNVQGTAHLDSGSIDKANEALTAAFDIPAQVWWRDDLDRRLENNGNIKWSYPEILKLTDVLPLLIRNPEDTEDLQAASALKGYMATQYSTDKDVKFKQVELQRRLTELFVDLPLGHKRPRTEQNRGRRFLVDDPDGIDAYISQLDSDEDYEFELDENPFDHSGLAAAFLLKMPPRKGVTRFVVEGAPGQGKSTVTQFLCQVNRLRLLKRDSELRAVDDSHKTAMARVPFRVDLRDYAAWINGRNPFANTTELAVPIQGSQSLENFLSNQVKWQSGGLEITVDELRQFFAKSHSVIVLDGFDEVADIATRERIVREVCIAADRLDTHIKPHAKSIQIIVTSRPAAFANSPGFPEDDWIYLELKDLRSDNINAYKDKWIRARKLNEEEADLVSSTLNDKLEQPHLRDLARNPMQLAILLHLIHVQGVALPEKRTMLYEEYIKLFFNREAEKSNVVRDHRELLLSIHGVLAWVLHTQAEDGAGSGSITKDALHDKVKTYLESEGHDPQLVEELLKGTAERICALVSRAEGTFEFEVQPLREYFAARHLYKTAPYSPVGQIHKGTKPERFQAIARSFYWTNVTRFFCGFYDRGELGSLVDGITDLGEQDGYNLINQPRRLAMMLLSDQVFSQAPKTMKRLVEFVAKEPGFHRLTSTVMTRFRGGLGLPAKAGGDALFESCEKKLAEESDPSRRKALRTVMAATANREKLKSTWISRFENSLMRCKPLHEAIDFGIVNRFRPEEIAKFTNEDLDSQLRWLILANYYETVAENPELYKPAKKAFFDDKLKFPLRLRHSTDSVTVLEALTELLRPHVLIALYSETETTLSAYSVLGRDYLRGGHKFLEQIKRQYEGSTGNSLESFTLFMVNLLSKDVKDWQQKLDPWSELVNRGFEEAPGNYLVVQIAIIATASNVKKDAGAWGKDGFAATKGLVSRLFFARHKGNDAAWWRGKLAGITSATTTQCLAILLSWGTPDVIAALKADIDSAIKKLSSHDWSRLWFIARSISTAISEDCLIISDDWFQATGDLSPRTALILIDRVEDREVVQRLSRDCFIDYDGDDAQILRYASRIELLESEKGSVNWDYVQRLSKHAHEIGVHSLFSVYSRLELKVPEDVAKSVLFDCENHSREMVTICEQDYAATVAQTTPKISQVAEANGWFTPSD